MFDTAVRGGSGRACATPLGTVDALRVSEPLALRIKDVDLAGARLTIRSAKGNKDRMVLLLQCVLGEMEAQLGVVRWEGRFGIAHGAGWAREVGFGVAGTAICREKTSFPILFSAFPAGKTPAAIVFAVFPAGKMRLPAGAADEAMA